MERYIPLIEKVMRISAARFADRLSFMETLQQHKVDFSLLLQHNYDRMLQGTAR